MTKALLTKLRLLSQMLLRPQSNDPVEIVRHMGAVQAQDYGAMRWAIGIRMGTPSLKSFREAFDSGKIIRTHLNRATWQLIAGEELGWRLTINKEADIRRLTQWARMQGFQNEVEDGKEYGKVKDLLIEILSGKPEGMSFGDIDREFRIRGMEMQQYRFGHHLRMAQTEGIVCSGHLEGHKCTYALCSERIPFGESVPDRDEALGKLAEGYFRGHGPATLTDYVWWSGLGVTECKRGMAVVGESLESFTMDGNTYYMLRDRCEGRMDNTIVHHLPPYDEWLIGYKDRSHSIADQHIPKAHNKNGLFFPVILYRGQVVGNWSKGRKLECDFFGEVPSKEALQKSENRYLTFIESI